MGPLERELHIRYDIRNDADEEKEEVFLILDRYLPGLRVLTGNGEELAYLPDEMVEQRVGDQDDFIRDAVGAESYDEGAFEDARILLVELPEALGSHEVLVLHLHHQDTVSPPQGGPLVREPRFEVREEKAHEGHDTFIEIEGPERSEISVTATVGDLSFRNLDSFLQVRADGGAGTAGFTYEVSPRSPEKWLIWSFFGALTALPLVILSSALMLEPEPWEFSLLGQRMGLFAPGERIVETLGAVGLTGTIAFMGLTRPRWVKCLYFLLPLVLYTMLLLWKFPS